MNLCPCELLVWKFLSPIRKVRSSGKEKRLVLSHARKTQQRFHGISCDGSFNKSFLEQLFRLGNPRAEGSFGWMKVHSKLARGQQRTLPRKDKTGALLEICRSVSTMNANSLIGPKLKS